LFAINDARPARKASRLSFARMRERAGGAFRDDDISDGSAQLMAQRQLAVSLVVALALLAAAGLRMATGPHENSAGMAARPQVMAPATPGKTLAQPRPGMIPG
jgi:hypothetical protein